MLLGILPYMSIVAVVYITVVEYQGECQDNRVFSSFSSFSLSANEQKCIDMQSDITAEASDSDSRGAYSIDNFTRII